MVCKYCLKWDEFAHACGALLCDKEIVLHVQDQPILHPIYDLPRTLRSLHIHDYCQVLFRRQSVLR